MNIRLPKDLSSNALKYIAMIAMAFDHFVSVFYPAQDLLRIPGRIVMPIMCFFISEGFFYTSNIKKYIFRLFAFAVVSHFFYVLYFGLCWWKDTSAFWGLALGLVALTAVKQDRLSLSVKVLIVIGCCLLAYPASWKYTAVLWIVSFGLFRGNFGKQVAAFAVVGMITYVLPCVIKFGWIHVYTAAVFLAVPLLALYKGRRGTKSAFLKWGFYAFYPVHLLILYIIRLIADI